MAAGILATGAPGRPKRRVNWLSLYRQRARLQLLVAANLEGPAVMVDAGALVVVLTTVSSVLAEK